MPLQGITLRLGERRLCKHGGIFCGQQMALVKAAGGEQGMLFCVFLRKLQQISSQDWNYPLLILKNLTPLLSPSRPLKHLRKVWVFHIKYYEVKGKFL